MKENIKKLKKNRKGFTLVELLVAFGILAVVMVMVGSIIKMGSGTYKGISDNLNLQAESQLAMSQIHEYVIDCNAAVAYDKNSYALYLFNAHSEDDKYDGYKLAMSSGTLWLYTRIVDTPSTSGFTDSDKQPMSRNVTSFEAELDGHSVKITLEYGLGGDTYTAEQTIAFRNPVEDIS